jgi:hypothetical protein
MRNSKRGGQMWSSRCKWQHTSKMYEVLPNSSRNWKAAQKPLYYICALLGFANSILCKSFCQAAFCCEKVYVFSVHFCVSAVLRSHRPGKITEKKEQRIWIKFCFKLGKTASETHRLHKEAFGDNALGQMQTYEWFKRFKKGRILVDDEEHSWRTSTGTTTENGAKVWY